MKHKWLGSFFCIGSLVLFSSISGFRTEEEAVQTIFDTSSEYMVLSILENEMEVLRREEKNMDVSELPEYVTRYPDLYAPGTEDSDIADTQGEEEKREKQSNGISENNKDKTSTATNTNEDKTAATADKDKTVMDTHESDNTSSSMQDITQKTAYLTFDDGPSEQTAIVLDILKEENIHATFFLIGEEITPEREAIVRRMVEEGHTVGLHTYCHDYDIIYRSVDDFLSDYEKLYQRLYEVTGIKPSIFRFPGGSTNRYGKNVIKILKSEMERRGFCYYDWNVSAEDMVGKPTRYSIRSNIFKDVFRYDEPVILMHDSAANALTVSMLKDIIQEIKKGGYGFDTLDHRESCQF